jgi:WD40 repeat protein
MMEIKMGNGVIRHVDTIKNVEGYGTNVLRWHPDSRHLAVSGGGKRWIFIWDTKEKRLNHKIDMLSRGSEEALTYSSDGKYLVGKRRPNECKNSHGLLVGCLALWSVEKNYLLVGQSAPQTTNILIPAPGDRVCDFISGPSNAKRPKLKFIDIPSFKIFDSHIDLDGPDTIAFSNNGKLLAEAYSTFGNIPTDRSEDRFHLRMWKFPEMELLWELNDVHKGSIVSLAFSKDDNYLVTGPFSSDKKMIKMPDKKERVIKAYLEPMKQFEATTGNFVRDIARLDQSPNLLHFLDERYILGVMGPRREIIIWDFLTGKEIDRKGISADRSICTAELSPDGKTLAFGKKDEVLLFQFDLPQADN